MLFLSSSEKISYSLSSSSMFFLWFFCLSWSVFRSFCFLATLSTASNHTFSFLVNCSLLRQSLISFCHQLTPTISSTSQRSNPLLLICCSIFSITLSFFLENSFNFCRIKLFKSEAKLLISPKLARHLLIWLTCHCACSAWEPTQWTQLLGWRARYS